MEFWPRQATGILLRPQETFIIIAQLAPIQQNHRFQHSQDVTGFKQRLRPFVSLICSSTWTRRAIFKITHSLFKHLRIAQCVFRLTFVVWTLFSHPCLEVPASLSAVLTCSRHLWFLNTKEWKTLNEKHNLFILGMSQFPKRHYWTHSTQRNVAWTNPKKVLILTCLFRW